MTNDMHCRNVMVGTEGGTFGKGGGVADVIGRLPKELAALGHDVRIFLPCYGSIDPIRWELRHTGVVRTLSIGGFDETVSILQTTLPDAPVIVYLLDNEEFFGRYQRIYLGLDQLDEQRRFLLFCRGLLEALPQLNFAPDIIHLNDWPTAPCTAYLRTTHRHLLAHGAARIVYTIHNLQYQGRWDPSILYEAGLDPASVFTAVCLEFLADLHWLKPGLMIANYTP